MRKRSSSYGVRLDCGFSRSFGSYSTLNPGTQLKALGYFRASFRDGAATRRPKPGGQASKDLPHPQEWRALGLVILKPPPTRLSL